MPTRRTILVIARSSKSGNDYQSQLQQDGSCAYQVLTEQDAPQLLPLLQSQQIDGILLELGCPQPDYLDVPGQVREQMGDRCPPVVVIGPAEIEVAVQAFRQGAADYLIADRTTPDDLCLALRNAIEQAQLRQEFQQSQERFQTSIENLVDCFGIFSSIRDESGQIVDFRIDYLNRAACENNQMPKEMQIGRRLCEVLPGHLESGLFDDYCRLVETGAPLTKDSLIYEDTFGNQQRLVRAFDIRATKLNDGFVVSWRNITHRKQTEIALQQSQTQLSLAMEAARMGSWEWDIPTNRVNWSANLERLFGMAPGSFDGRYETVMGMIHPHDLAWVQQSIWRAVYDRAEYNIEFRFIKPDGTMRWALGLGRVFYDATGNPIKMAGIDMDISERKQVEAALRESEQRFRNMADNASIMLWVTDRTGCCTYLSRSWYAFTGETNATGPGYGWLKSVHPEDYPRSKEIFLKASERQETFRLDYRLRRQDGEYRWAIDAANPWFGEDGEFKGYIGSVIDIHDRKQAEEALQQSEERYRTLFESMNEGFCVIEMLFDQHNTPCDYRFLEINPVFEQQTGLSQAEGKTARQLLPDLEPYWFEIYGNVALTGNPIRFEHGSDVMKRWFDVSAFRVGQPESRKVAILFKDISERKQAELEHQRSEERFRTLADNISQFAWMADEQGLIFWYNQRWFGYTGTTLEQMQGWGWQQVHHPEHVERVVKKFRHCIETGETWEDTFPLRGKDGQYRWFLSRAIPIRDEQGTVLRWFGTNTDITELRQTEIALKQTTERLNIALKSAPLTLFNQDLELRYTWIYNPTHNYSTEQVIGLRDEDLTSPDAATYLTQLKRQVLNTGNGLREEVKITRNGQTNYYDLTIDPIRDSQNAIVGITCAAVDITDRKQAEEALRDSEERFRIAIESAQLGTWDWNLVTNQLTWDLGCKAMFGLPPEAESNIEVFFAGLHPADRERLEQIIQWSLNPDSGGNFDTEYRTIGIQDGIERWIAARGQAYFDAGGNPRRFIGTVLNITRQKRVEAEQEQLLQREQAAREAAETANRIKDEFLAVLSHELRSPLNPILGWAKLLQTRRFNESQIAEALATIERNARLQTQLIDDLLDVAKILRGKLSLNMTAVNLSAVIEAATDTVRTAALAKSISLDAILLDIGQISGDAARLQQIVWNLLSNAIKFTPNGGRVEVRLEQDGRKERDRGSREVPSACPYAQITVTDTGKGINPDFLPHIFESFRQEDASTTRKYGGLGLGLAIVRQLVEAHGGTISAESPGEGMGATFRVRFPLLEREGLREDPNRAHHPPLLPFPYSSHPSSTLLTGIRILTVDDDPDATLLMAALLTELGAEVISVTSASQALVVLESSQPDILISDIGMPDVDGYLLIQQIRAFPAEKGGRIPAIALTAYAREDDYQRALASGYQQHITKPLDPEKLVQAIVSLNQGNFKRPDPG